MITDRWTQFNAITDIWAPRYSTEDVLIACHKVNRSPLDIKLRFAKVNPTDEWSGNWFLSRKTCKRFKKRFNNNGLGCYVVPLDKLEKLQIAEKSLHDL